MDGELGVLEPLDDSGSRQYFAWRLRATRRAYGGLIGTRLSARRFARMLDLDPARYTRYERGELEPPLTVLIKLRRLTGVSLDRLIAGEAAGDDNMISVHGMQSVDEVILGDRLRWVRELGEPSVERTAELMQVPLADWQQWESGATRPPLDKLYEFSIRFRVTMDFLVSGSLECLDAFIRNLLVTRYPQLRPQNHPQRGPDNTVGGHTSHRAQADIGRSGMQGGPGPGLLR